MNTHPHTELDPLPEAPHWPELRVDVADLRMIAFEGAGVTGVLYTGAMQALEEADLLHNIQCFAGTSAGSIVAAAAALGYRGKALQNIALKQDFRAFCRTNGYWLHRLRENMQRNGLFSGGELRRWLSNLFARRIARPDLTFEELEQFRQQATAAQQDDPAAWQFFKSHYEHSMEHKPFFARFSRHPKQFRYDFERDTPKASILAMIDIAAHFVALRVTATELSYEPNLRRHRHPVIFDADSWPELPIVDAVRASSSYPYVFRDAHLFDAQGRMHIMTDGAYSCPIPMQPPAESGIETTQILGFSSDYFPDHPRQERAKDFRYRQLQKMLASQVGKRLKAMNPASPLTITQLGLRQMRRDWIEFMRKGEQQMVPQLKQRIIPLNRYGIPGDDFMITFKDKQRLIHTAKAFTEQIIARKTE